MKFIRLIFFVCISFFLFASEDYRGLDFKIKFFNQSIYDINSDILIEVALSNSSNDVLILEIGNSNVFGFDFNVTDTSNVKVKRPIKYVKERFKNVAIPVRNLSLRPNEKYSIVMKLNQFVKFGKEGVYFVKGVFFPDISDPSKKVESNIVTLFLKNKIDIDSNIDLNNLSANNEIRNILNKQKLSPDDIVIHLLKALQLGEKEKFFLYIDLESLMLNDDKNKSYLYKHKQQLSSATNNNVVEEYKDYLWNSYHSDISKIPSKFSIIETTYSDTTGRVIADLYFDDGHFYISKRYTFFFKKYDYYWIIYDYIVQNTGIKEK